MRTKHVPLADTNSFSGIFLDYINKKEELTPFYNLYPSIENFEDLLTTRQLSSHHRSTLVDVLSQQYGPLNTPEAVEFNIHSLTNSKTFTVTTGHQLNIFTGPLYFIYKILTVINTCRQLKAKYHDYHFVPVYWMASEDHDFAEINHFNLFGKKYEWETPQKGPVGKFKPYTLNNLIDQINESLPLFEQAYLDHNNLAGAVRFYVNELFGDQGLVVVDADNKKLKKLFAPIIREDILENRSYTMVTKASQALKDIGYNDQAFSREINFFYMHKDIRERIEKDGELYKVVNTDITLTREELSSLIDHKPHYFSPNVIMRPVYQETILPNLAYVGGPSEIAYWLQLQETFIYYHLNFPILMPRNFVTVFTKSLDRKMKKLKLREQDVFLDVHLLKERYLKRHGENMHELNAEKKKIDQVFNKIKAKAIEIDGSLEGFIRAECSKALKSIENIGKRLKKAEESNNEVAMNQIDSLKEKLFPGGTLQERHDNFLNFYINNHHFVRQVREKLDPFEFSMHILHEA